MKNVLNVIQSVDSIVVKFIDLDNESKILFNNIKLIYIESYLLKN